MRTGLSLLLAVNRIASSGEISKGSFPWAKERSRPLTDAGTIWGSSQLHSMVQQFIYGPSSGCKRVIPVRREVVAYIYPAS